MRMMKVLAALLVCASTAGATVIDVVAYDIGQSGGRLGLSPGAHLQPSDKIGIKIVLNYNPHPSYPSYDGYVLSDMDLDLHVTGAASLSHTGLTTAGVIRTAYRHLNFGPWYNSEVTSTGVARIVGAAIPPIVGGEDLVWGFTLHCDGEGMVVVDLTLAGLSEYKPFADSPAWLAMTSADLGDLVIYQIPEPASAVIMSVGAFLLALKRRRKMNS